MYGLSLLTRDREYEGLMPNASSFARIVNDFIGLPLSLCNAGLSPSSQRLSTA
jgi:hypothetical protein